MIALCVGSLTDAGKHAESAELNKSAITILRKVYGPHHPEVATLLNNTANHYLREGKVKLAEPMMREALRIRSEVYGEDHPE